VAAIASSLTDVSASQVTIIIIDTAIAAEMRRQLSAKEVVSDHESKPALQGVPVTSSLVKAAEQNDEETKKAATLTVSYKISGVTALQSTAVTSEIAAIASDSITFTTALKNKLTTAGAVVPGDITVRASVLTSDADRRNLVGSSDVQSVPEVGSTIYFELEDAEKWAKGKVEKVDKDGKTVDVMVQASDDGSSSNAKSQYASNLELSKEIVNKLTKSLANDYVDNNKHLTHLQFVEAVPRLLKEMIR
jgi:hypothetical protein